MKKTKYPRIGNCYAWLVPDCEDEEFVTVEVLENVYDHSIHEITHVKIRVVEVPRHYKYTDMLYICINGKEKWTEPKYLFELERPVNPDEMYNVEYTVFRNCRENFSNSHIDHKIAGIIAPSAKEAIRRIVDYIVQMEALDDVAKYNTKIYTNGFVLRDRLFVTHPELNTIEYLYDNFKAYYSNIKI